MNRWTTVLILLRYVWVDAKRAHVFRTQRGKQKQYDNKASLMSTYTIRKFDAVVLKLVWSTPMFPRKTSKLGQYLPTHLPTYTTIHHIHMTFLSVVSGIRLQYWVSHFRR